MATTEWVDVEEGECLLALEEFHRRDLTYKEISGTLSGGGAVDTLDNLAEYTRGRHNVALRLSNDHQCSFDLYLLHRSLERASRERGVRTMTRRDGSSFWPVAKDINTR